MSEIINRLASLTSVRDRDALDIALVSTISDMIQPESAAICRVVGERNNGRWLISAKLNAGQSHTTSDSAWTSLDLLPQLSAHPLRQQALETRLPQFSNTSPSISVFPLSGASDANGVLEIGSPTPLSIETQRLVTGVLSLYRNFMGLLDYSERDSLTELLNRKTFDGAFLKATIEQNQSHTSPEGDRRDTETPGTYWLVMIDIDHFKRVNDNFGHLIGDEVLLLLARLMREHFRYHDQLYRFGGEEFVVLMRCKSEDEAKQVLERFRLTVQAYAFPQVGTITISVGFSQVKAGDTPSGAFERADKAVYHAKGHGRNQVCSYSALVASGDLVEQVDTSGDMELF